MKYSDRIKKTVELIEPGYCMADIGCDHGYMSILAAQNSLFQKIYACDINEGPLSRAKENIISFDLNNRILPLLSNGLTDVPADVTCAVICGMGGLLIKKILEDSPEKTNCLKQLVLGPHSETEELRNWIINESPFDIIRETAVFDGGKHYTLMDVRPKDDSNKSKFYFSEEDIKFGTKNNQTDLDSYTDYLSYLANRANKALSMCLESSNERSVRRASELKEEIVKINHRLNDLKENY